MKPTSGDERPRARLTPINAAEAIVEPFWDPYLSGLGEWQVECGDDWGLQVRQDWCWAAFEWRRKPAAGPAVKMTRRFRVDCSGYDHLMVSLKAPERVTLRLSAETERGAVVLEEEAQCREHLLHLGDAQRLHAVTLELIAQEEGPGSGWLNWVGLHNSRVLPHHLEQWRHFDEDWHPYLQPPGHTPGYRPRHGIVLDDDGVAALRGWHADRVRAGGISPFTRTAEEAADLRPESQIEEFVAQVCGSRYARERDEDQRILGPGWAAAVAGLVLEDEALLRLAARYALALAAIPVWDSGVECYFPGGIFEHRSFSQSACAEEAALILDLAGEMFTDAGRDLVQRRLAEHGLGNINFVAWRHEYIHHNNQLAAFSAGRLLGYGVLEKTMSRVRPYMELAYQDLVDSLVEIVLADGGFVEGPSYFFYTMGNGGRGLYYYARARGLDIVQVLPEPLKATGAFAAAIASTLPDADVIPICDASATYSPEPMALLAAAMPESPWVSIFRKALARSEGMVSSILVLSLEPRIPSAGPEAETFVTLPEMGLMASTRKLGEVLVKILIPGNRAGAGHTHEDKGSFVLEFAGEAFAMDPGTCDYGNPLSSVLKHCERHSMLVPCGFQDRPHPECPLAVDVKPEGHGDADRFEARIDLASGWEGYYRCWRRTWRSDAPDALTIRDEYELADGSGVEFYWQTALPVSEDGDTITIRGKKGTVVLTVPDDCDVRVDRLPLADGQGQNRIALRREGTAGSLEVAARLMVE